MINDTFHPMSQMIDKMIDNLMKQFFAGEISFETALKIAQQQVTTAVKIDKKLAGKIYNIIGTIYTEQGDYDKALESFILGKEAFSSINLPEGVAAGFINIGEIHRELMNYEEALACYQQACDIAREHDNAVSYAYSIANQGFVNMEMGNFAEAYTLYNEILEFAKNRPDTWDLEFTNRLVPEIYANLARICAYLKKIEEAHAYVQRAIAIGARTNDMRIAGWTAHAQLAICFNSEAPITEARSHFEDGVNMFSAMRANRDLADVYLLWAAYCERNDLFDEAKMAYRNALPLLEKLHHHVHQFNKDEHQHSPNSSASR